MSDPKETGIRLYCTKCKEKNIMSDIKGYTMDSKNGKKKHFITGICTKCNKKTSQFANKDYFDGKGLLSFIPFVGPVLDTIVNNADKVVDVASGVQGGLNSLKEANDARRKAAGKGLFLPSGGELKGKGLYLPTGKGLDANEIRVLKQAAKILERL